MNPAFFKLTGRSGCQLEMIADGKSPIVRKYSKDQLYNSRLISQAEKQISFRKCSVFRSPDVLIIDRDATLASFDMEYVKGEKFSEFMLRCDISKLNELSYEFIQFIENEFSQASETTLQPSVFIDKIETIRTSLPEWLISEKKIEKTIRFLTNEFPDSLFPRGICHGDLTLSNIIFSNGYIYLIDFLDTFVESPLNDIVKLRQDTKFYWSLQLDKLIPPYHKNKMIQVLRHLDRIIDDHFKENCFYVSWYSYLEKMNLFRILPYLSDKKEIDFVLNALN